MSRVIVARLSVVTEATALPLTVPWAKDHIKSVSDSDDELIESWIVAAAQYFEEITGRQIMRAGFEYSLDAFPGPDLATGLEMRIELPKPPLVEVQSIEYVDAGGTVRGFSDGASPETVYWRATALAGVHAGRGWVEPIVGQVWPLARDEAGAVRIRFTAGYAETSFQVPPLVRTILALLVANWDQFRSEQHLSERSSSVEQLPFGIQQLMRGFMHHDQQVLRRR